MTTLSWKTTPLIWFLPLLGHASAQVRFECDPCVERSSYKILGIAHGSQSDSFWQQVEASMVQASKDMKVEFEMTLLGDESSDMNTVYQNMASKITKAAESADALVVTVPDTTVEAAVKNVIAAGTPVFGFDTGYESALSIGMSAFIGMDDELAGRVAAENFLKSGATITNALFISVADANAPTYSKRSSGFLEGLTNATAGARRQEMTVDSPANAVNAISMQLMGCPYEAILVGTPSDVLVQETLSAVKKNNCANTRVGTFGASVEVHQAVSSGDLAFSVSQQPYLQGAMSVVHTALYVSTGKHLAPSSASKYGMVLSGPTTLDSTTVYTDTMQVCERDAFPVCPNEMALDGVTKSQCACTDRKKLKIAGVLHAVTTDEFWDIVYTSANQAADDFGVELEMDRMEPDEADVLHFLMATKIEKLCKEGVDGIFVTIPSEAVLEAIELCQQLHIPVISINAGPDFSHDLGLQHHIGMVERTAGYLAGQRMVATGKMTRAVCGDHAPGNVVLIDRCGGFKQAIEEAGNIQYIGQLTVPEDNDQLYMKEMEAFVGEEGDWTGLGILLGGPVQARPALSLKEKHKDVLLGSFDTSDVLYKGMDEGNILFGIDQGPYLQGYLPIPLLVWEAQTTQNTVNHLIESGPDFVLSSPSQAKQTCELEHFKTCQLEKIEAASGSSTNPSVIGESGSRANDVVVSNTAAIVVLSIVAVACVLFIGLLMYRMNRLKKYVHRLEEQGNAAPQLKTGDYMNSVFHSPEQIVERRRGAGVNEKDRTDPSENA